MFSEYFKATTPPIFQNIQNEKKNGSEEKIGVKG
jgi:hypothetical protein